MKMPRAAAARGRMAEGEGILCRDRPCCAPPRSIALPPPGCRTGGSRVEIHRSARADARRKSRLRRGPMRRPLRGRKGTPARASADLDAQRIVIADGYLDPAWGDRGGGDPGITIMELFAWLAESMTIAPAGSVKTFRRRRGIAQHAFMTRRRRHSRAQGAGIERRSILRTHSAALPPRDLSALRGDRGARRARDVDRELQGRTSTIR